VRPVAPWLLAVAFHILVAGAFFTPRLVTHSADVAESSSVPPIASPTRAESPDALNASDEWGGPESRDERGELSDSADGFTDLYGNEVTDAIATYTFDQSGSLYELHSPQTELPRLGIPKS
jgi:hypothetical protein